jgi:hypothetical protein
MKLKNETKFHLVVPFKKAYRKVAAGEVIECNEVDAGLILQRFGEQMRVVREEENRGEGRGPAKNRMVGGRGLDKGLLSSDSAPISDSLVEEPKEAKDGPEL